MAKENKSNIIIYQSEDGQTHIEVQMDEDTVWLSQQQMGDLYQTSRTNVVEHIKHIYEDGELVEESTCRKIRQVRQEGARMVEREIPHYNLDMIISLGYRIIQFKPHTSVNGQRHALKNISSKASPWTTND